MPKFKIIYINNTSKQSKIGKTKNKHYKKLYKNDKALIIKKLYKFLILIFLINIMFLFFYLIKKSIIKDKINYITSNLTIKTEDLNELKNLYKNKDFQIKNEFRFKYNNTEIKIESENEFLSFCNGKNESEIADLYFKLCNEGFLFDKVAYKKVINPKISIIIIALNREEFILRILRSIQNQPMKDIEIIFVDDASSDNSVKLLEIFQKYDERIIIIKHETNKGSLISRNEGAYNSKGEYIFYSDSDDLLLYDILNKAYKAAKNGDFEIVQFGVYRRDKKGIIWNYGEIRNTTPIYQPKLSSLMYYYRGYLKQTDWHIWGKLIKKEAFLRALDSIDNYYLNSSMSINEDGLVDFMLLKKAKSFIYIRDYGYIYFWNDNSIIHNLQSNINRALKDYFLYLKYLFEHTENNEYEKSMAGDQLNYVYNKFIRDFRKATKNFAFMYEILNLYINCPYINLKNKNKAKIISNILERREKFFK